LEQFEEVGVNLGARKKVASCFPGLKTQIEKNQKHRMELTPTLGEGEKKIPLEKNGKQRKRKCERE